MHICIYIYIHMYINIHINNMYIYIYVCGGGGSKLELISALYRVLTKGPEKNTVIMAHVIYCLPRINTIVYVRTLSLAFRRVQGVSLLTVAFPTMSVASSLCVHRSVCVNVSVYELYYIHRRTSVEASLDADTLCREMPAFASMIHWLEKPRSVFKGRVPRIKPGGAEVKVLGVLYCRLSYRCCMVPCSYDRYNIIYLQYAYPSTQI